MNELSYLSELLFFSQSIKEVNAIKILNSIELKINQKIVYPIKFSGFLQGFIFYIQLNPTDDKAFEDFISSMKSRLSLLFLKEIKLEILEKRVVDFGKLKNNKNYIIFFYDNFLVLVSLVFFEALYKALFGQEIKINDEKELILFRDKFFKKTISFPWRFEDFTIYLDSTQLQSLLNQLLCNNIIEETMLSALVAGCGKYGIKILNNLSKNVKQEINDILSRSTPSLRWIKQTFYLVETSIGNLIKENILRLSLTDWLLEIKSAINKSYYFSFFNKRDFFDYLVETEKDGIMQYLISCSPFNILARSLINCNPNILEIIKRYLPEKSFLTFKEDIEYEKRKSTLFDIFEARIEIVKKLREIKFEKLGNKKLKIEEILLKVKPEDMDLIIDEVNILNFARATFNFSTKLKQELFSKISGIRESILSDIYKGIIKFKSSFGEQTIKKFQNEICKLVWIYQDEGKINLLQ